LLFWLLCLPIPLVKVALDQRSQPRTRSTKVRIRRTNRWQPVVQRWSQWRTTVASALEVATRPAPQSAQPATPAPEIRRSLVNPLAEQHNRQWHSTHSPVADEITESLSLLQTERKPAEPENITAVAEYQLSQTDSQIEKIKTILASALRNRVSDIHLEPITEGLRVRYRIDGILRDVTLLPPEISRRAIVALKVMADMDISDSRRPQDARISEHFVSEENIDLDLDLRVSTLPCVGGEKAVIRLLPRQNPFSSIDQIGFTEKALATYTGWLKQPQGMVIFTGPTGSGKTSTLYTSLQTIATETVNVVTVEDPVEYVLPDITQTQVNEAAGMTFAAGLRAILRQDPDIIMVGEIRDNETAETAVRAALTGHLVLTTLHTNDALGVIPRLKDIGPDPGLISDALLGVIAQRLVRRICPHCAEPYTPTAADLQVLGLRLTGTNSHSWRRGRGCSQCFDSGYLGREAIIELLHVDDTVRRIIYEGSITDLLDHLNANNFDSFRQAAIAKVISGVTTVEEIQRVLPHSKLAGEFQ
jgi:type II secretory ATPase GspE/PulE/Tfp pilus assembly ATPase PilB-like protein